MDYKRGTRLGRKFAKIWKWMTARSKKTRYIRLHSQKPRRNRRHGFNILNPLRIRIHRKPKSQDLSCPNFSNSKGGSPILSGSGTFSPEYGMESVLLNTDKPNKLYSQSQCLHLPHFRVQSLHFPHISGHWHLPHRSHDNHGRKVGMRKVYQSFSSKTVPKGFLAVFVGQGEDHHRFVIPVIDFNHPLFAKLLEDAEEQYGFDQKGVITLPCQIADFEQVQKLIHTEHRRKH